MIAKSLLHRFTCMFNCGVYTYELVHLRVMSLSHPCVEFYFDHGPKIGNPHTSRPDDKVSSM